jgi:preprotein translocase subunit SecE
LRMEIAIALVVLASVAVIVLVVWLVAQTARRNRTDR